MRQDVFLDRVPQLGIDMATRTCSRSGLGRASTSTSGNELGVARSPASTSRRWPSSGSPPVSAAHVHAGRVGAVDAPLEDGAYDVVTAFDVMYHIVDEDGLRAGAGEHLPSLRPGGLFLVADHFLHHEQSIRARGPLPQPHAGPLRGALQRQGLEIVQRRPMFVLMNAPPGLAQPAAPRLVARRRRDGVAGGAARLRRRRDAVPDRAATRPPPLRIRLDRADGLPPAVAAPVKRARALTSLDAGDGPAALTATRV